jgi:hypothetical protein
VVEQSLKFLVVGSELLNLTHYQVERIFRILNRGTGLLTFQRVVDFDRVGHLFNHGRNHRQRLDLHAASKNVLVAS